MTGLLTEPHEKKQWLPDLLGNGRELHDVKRFVEHGRAHTRVHDHGSAALPAEERLEEPRQLAFSERDNQRVAPAAKDEAELRIWRHFLQQKRSGTSYLTSLPAAKMKRNYIFDITSYSKNEAELGIYVISCSGNEAELRIWRHFRWSALVVMAAQVGESRDTISSRVHASSVFFAHNLGWCYGVTLGPVLQSLIK